MRTTLLGLCTLCVAAAANAQVSPGATLIGAQASSGAVAAPMPPAQSAVWPGLSRIASGAVGTSSFAVEHALDELAIDLQWQLASQAWQPGVAVARADVRYEFTSPITQFGMLSIEWAPQLQGTGVATLAVDVFEDGFVDANGSYALPVAFNQTPLVVVVRAEVRADAGVVNGPWGTSWNWSGQASADLRVRFVPIHANATVAATSTCANGPLLEARPDLHGGVRLDALAAPADELLVFALGFAPENLPLPWSNGCTLLVDPVATGSALLAGDPSASWSVAVPAAVRPVSFYAQVLTFDADAVAIRAGHALRVDVP